MSRVLILWLIKTRAIFWIIIDFVRGITANRGQVFLLQLSLVSATRIPLLITIINSFWGLKYRRFWFRRYTRSLRKIRLIIFIDFRSWSCGYSGGNYSIYNFNFWYRLFFIIWGLLFKLRGLNWRTLRKFWYSRLIFA